MGAAARPAPADGDQALPTVPCTVVWSHGRAYVLQCPQGRPRWEGIDSKGRPQTLTAPELQRRGWSYHRAG